MKLEIVNISGSKQGEFDIADELLIKNGKGTQALHDAVVAYKQRGEVNGTGKKPWKQKGTGRARAGSFQSPIWRGGAVVFGPQPRDYSIQVPKKTKALAFRKALSERLLAGDVIVVDDIKLSSHKTKEFAGIVGKLSPVSSTLIVAAEVDANLKKASRNLAGVQVQRADALNVYELLRFEKIVVTRAAAEQIQARLAKS
jgi:large subunit ribosomal protein L4